jgi:Cys-tRNA(Pro)/Cys-tRNA(Cys) deacylase
MSPRLRTHAIRALDEAGVPFEVLRHAHRATNVEEAAAERDMALSQIVKTILVRRARGYVLVLVRGDLRLSLKKLARLLGDKQVELAAAQDVPRITGYQIGAVAPVGLRRSDTPVWVDEHILEQEHVSISAGRHDAGLLLRTEDLVRTVGGRVADLTE